MDITVGAETGEIRRSSHAEAIESHEIREQLNQLSQNSLQPNDGVDYGPSVIISLSDRAIQHLAEDEQIANSNADAEQDQVGLQAAALASDIEQNRIDQVAAREASGSGGASVRPVESEDDDGSDFQFSVSSVNENDSESNSPGSIPGSLSPLDGFDEGEDRRPFA